MKPWIKLYYAMLQDERVQLMMKKEMVSGLGIYVLAMLYTGCVNEQAAEVDSEAWKELFRFLNGYASRGQIERVLNDYDLFTQAGTQAAARADARAEARAGEPSIEKNRIEKNIIIDKVLPEAFLPYRNLPCLPYILPLADESQNQIWWETVCMKASGWSTLLLRHRQDTAVYYLRHVVATGSEKNIVSEQEAKRHLMNLILHAEASEALKKYLQELES